MLLCLRGAVGPRTSVFRRAPGAAPQRWQRIGANGWPDVALRRSIGVTRSPMCAISKTTNNKAVWAQSARLKNSQWGQSGIVPGDPKTEGMESIVFTFRALQSL